MFDFYSKVSSFNAIIYLKKSYLCCKIYRTNDALLYFKLQFLSYDRFINCFYTEEYTQFFLLIPKKPQAKPVIIQIIDLRSFSAWMLSYTYYFCSIWDMDKNNKSKQTDKLGMATNAEKDIRIFGRSSDWIFLYRLLVSRVCELYPSLRCC